MAEKRASIYAIVALIIGLLIGAAIGYIIKPAPSISAELEELKSKYNELSSKYSELESKYSELESKYNEIEKSYNALKSLIGTFPKEGVIKLKAWCGGAPAEGYRAKNLERGAELLNKILKSLGLNVKVEIEATFEHVPRDAARSRLMAAWEAKEAPDIVIDYGYSAVELADMGWAVPLDEYYEKYSVLFADVPRSMWELRYNGHIWTIPQDAAMHVFYFRKDVLRKMGWSEEEINALAAKINNGETTFEDIMKIAKEAMDKGLVEWGIYHRKGPGGSLWIPYYSLGGKFYDPETGKLTISKSKLLDYFTLFYKMTQVYKVTPPTMIATDWRKIHTDFVNGRVLFWMGGSWHWGEWQRVEYHETLGKLTPEYAWENIGFSLYPATKPGANPGAFVGPHGYVILSQSKYPEVAFLVAALATTPEFEADHCVEGARLPTHAGTRGVSKFVEQGKFLAELSKLTDKTWAEWMPHSEWSKLVEILTEALTKVEAGEISPQDAVDLVVSRAKAEITNIIITD
ncbi:MAG TPA: extracellular solute-binding protein [Candidatus Bathyarchaeota archaeon]|nr:extracellular solute-binding protein [Candidatus Bathyarchaeota archaeon]